MRPQDQRAQQDQRCRPQTDKDDGEDRLSSDSGADGRPGPAEATTAVDSGDRTAAPSGLADSAGPVVATAGAGLAGLAELAGLVDGTAADETPIVGACGWPVTTGILRHARCLGRRSAEEAAAGVAGGAAAAGWGSLDSMAISVTDCGLCATTGSLSCRRPATRRLSVGVRSIGTRYWPGFAPARGCTPFDRRRRRRRRSGGLGRAWRGRGGTPPLR